MFTVWSLQIEVWSLKSEVCSLEFEVEVWSLENLEVWSLKFGSLEVWSLESGVWSVNFGVWSLQFDVWKLEIGVWKSWRIHWRFEEWSFWWWWRHWDEINAELIVRRVARSLLSATRRFTHLQWWEWVHGSAEAYWEQEPLDKCTWRWTEWLAPCLL